MNNTKARIAMRYWLLGAEFYKASEAMDLGEATHLGVRKDGITPEFAHQIAIASHVRTLGPWLRFPQETITTAFLHDIREDYNVADAVIRTQFGDVVADAVWALTKEFDGVRRDDADVFDGIGRCPIASITKLADRIHNISTMQGVFSVQKVQAYVEETKTFFVPMLKVARRRFPDQEGAYENLKLMLTSQLALIAVATGTSAVAS